MLDRRRVTAPARGFLSRTLVPLAVIAGLTLLYFGRLFVPLAFGRAVVVRGDFTDEFFALHYYAYHALRNGHLPLWNSETYGGYPFLADVQTAVYYPFHLVVDAGLLLLRVPEFPLGALELMLPLHVFLAASFTYALARSENLRRTPAVLAGLGFGFGGFLLSYPLQQLSILETAAWLPALLLGLRRALQATTWSGRVGWSIALGWAFSCALLAGHPQTTLYLVVAVGAEAAFVTAREAGSAGWGRRTGASLLVVSGALTLGVLLAAAQLIPSLELARLSTRTGMPYVEAAHGFSWSDVSALFRPSSYFTRALTVGPLALALGLLAFAGGRRARSGFWAALAGVGVLLSLGGNAPLFPVLYRVVPGFNLFRDQERAIVLTSLAVAMLAARGLDVLLAGGPRVARRRFVLVGITVLVAISAVFLVMRGAPPAEGARPALTISTLGAVLLLGYLARSQPARFAGPLLVGMLALSLLRLNWVGNFAPIGTVPVYPTSPLVAYLQERPAPYRVATGGLWPADHGYVDGLADVSGMSEMRVRRYAALQKALRRDRFLQLFGVRYIVSWRGDLADRPTARLRLHLVQKEASSPFTGAPLYLYEIENAAPLVSGVNRVQSVPDEERLVRFLNHDSFDLGDAAARIDAHRGAEHRHFAAARVDLRRWRDGTVSFDVQANGPAYLVVRQVTYPGWSARLDGAPHPLEQIDGGLQGVAVGGGRHSLLLQYDPLSVKIGGGISLAAALGSLLVLEVARRRGRARPSS